MEVLNLATKEKQDLIKQDTTNILSNFPISRGTDFSKMFPVFGYGSGITTILEVTGKGFGLIQIPNYSDTTYTGIGVKITVDGNVVFDSTITASSNRIQVFVGDRFYSQRTEKGHQWLVSSVGFQQSFKVEKTAGTINQSFDVFALLEV